MIRGRVRYTQASKNPFTSVDQNRKDRINSTAITASGGRSLICPSGKYDFLFWPDQPICSCLLSPWNWSIQWKWFSIHQLGRRWISNRWRCLAFRCNTVFFIWNSWMTSVFLQAAHHLFRFEGISDGSLIDDRCPIAQRSFRCLRFWGRRPQHLNILGWGKFSWFF